jgi:acylphosphatase
VAKHLIIRGRVQGVGYRASMVDEALRIGVTGWVRNRRDGTVEAVVDGDANAVAALIEWTKIGPRGAHVSDVVVSESNDSGYADFDWRPTV